MFTQFVPPEIVVSYVTSVDLPTAPPAPEPVFSKMPIMLVENFLFLV